MGRKRWMKYRTRGGNFIIFVAAVIVSGQFPFFPRNSGDKLSKLHWNKHFGYYPRVIAYSLCPVYLLTWKRALRISMYFSPHLYFMRRYIILQRRFSLVNFLARATLPSCIHILFPFHDTFLTAILKKKSRVKISMFAITSVSRYEWKFKIRQVSKRWDRDQRREPPLEIRCFPR